MRLARNLVLVFMALALIVACASTPQGRYYENLDMYDFVMTKFRATYEASTVAEQQTMDKEVLPLLNAWAKARKVWKLSMNDATKEEATMLAWAEAKAALITYGIVTVKELQEVE